MGDQARVVTWNVWGRHGPWTDRQVAIERWLRDVEPDVVVLQEAWTAEPRSQAELLADALGLDHVDELAPRSTVRPFGGLALVSRWPIVDRNQLRLPDLGRDADRWLLAGAIDHPSGGFRAAVTHLSWRLDDGDLRRAQVDAIVTHLEAQPPQPGPTVLAGDLNAPPDADEIRLLTGRHSQGPRSSASLPDY